MLIRQASLIDCKNLASLDQICNPHAWSEQQFISTINQPTNSVFLIEDDNQIIGFIIWNKIIDESELHLLAISPFHRRKGLASLLIKYWLSETQLETKVDHFLEVRESNLAAIKLYEKHGFQEYNRRKDYYLISKKQNTFEDAIWMKKNS